MPHGYKLALVVATSHFAEKYRLLHLLFLDEIAQYLAVLADHQQLHELPTQVVLKPAEDKDYLVGLLAGYRHSQHSLQDELLMDKG